MSASAREVIADEMQKRRDFSYSTREYWLADADAILAALSAAGFVIVPREPTEMMQGKGAAQAIRVLQARGVPFDTNDITSIWSAMLSAAEGKK